MAGCLCLSLYVDAVYNSHSHHNGTSLLLATYFFAFQIYCDFSGYSDIARGVSRIYGIELMKNFETPYFATSISEFWSRWHISLSTWFRDYVYIPLGGNRVPLTRNLGNLFFVFLLSGFWHGANWTFVLWGMLHGIYLIAERLIGLATNRSAIGTRDDTAMTGMRLVKLMLTFHLVLVSWVFFRADSLSTAMSVLRKMLLDHGVLFWDAMIPQSLLAIAALLVLDLFNRRTDYWARQDNFHVWFRTADTVALLFAIILFGIERGTQFIYFQF